MQTEIYETFTEAWLNELRLTRTTGYYVSPRGMGTFERLYPSIIVTDPLSIPLSKDVRNFKDAIGILEGLSLVGQVSIPETFTRRVRKFNQFTDGGIFHGAYANRIAGSLVDLVSLIERDGGTRQAVLSIFDSARDLDRQKADIPCTIALQFFVRGESLDIRVMMRSNDLWLGMPYDFMQFAILQAAIAQALDLEMGHYVHQVGSLHLYERDMDAADDAIQVGSGCESSMEFPFFYSEDGTIGDISRRARDLLLLPTTQPRTQFEEFVMENLHG